MLKKNIRDQENNCMVDILIALIRVILKIQWEDKIVKIGQSHL